MRRVRRRAIHAGGNDVHRLLSSYEIMGFVGHATSVTSLVNQTVRQVAGPTKLLSSHAHVRTALPKPGRCRRSHEGVRT